MTDRPSDRAELPTCPWRKSYGEIIKQLAVLACLHEPEQVTDVLSGRWERELIDRESVMQAVSRIRESLDKASKASREIDAAAPEGAQAVAADNWTPEDIQAFARAYKQEVPGASLTVHGIAFGLKALRRPPSQDAEDAARYRLIRSRINGSPAEWDRFVQTLDAGEDGQDSDAFDRCIDAARAAEGDGHG